MKQFSIFAMLAAAGGGSAPSRSACRSGLRATDSAGREGPDPDQVAPLGLVGSVVMFGAGALLLFLTTRVAVPTLVAATGAEPVVMWFLAASAVLFGPLLLTATLLLYRERRSGKQGSLGARLWLRPMNGGDWLWALAGLATVGVLTGGIGAVLGMLQDETSLHPSFMAFEPLGPGRYWILGAWLPFFVLNIVGEEFVWRGVVLPRQQVGFGGRACLVNGILWLLVPRCLPMASPVNPCADHVHPTIHRPAAAQHVGWDRYPRRVRSSGLLGSSIRACLKSPHSAEPSAAADGGRDDLLERQALCLVATR